MDIFLDGEGGAEGTYLVTKCCVRETKSSEQGEFALQCQKNAFQVNGNVSGVSAETCKRDKIRWKCRRL